jgi:hypothetical protein
MFQFRENSKGAKKFIWALSAAIWLACSVIGFFVGLKVLCSRFSARELFLSQGVRVERQNSCEKFFGTEPVDIAGRLIFGGVCLIMAFRMIKRGPPN